MTKLSTLCQTTDHISQSLQALLEHLPSITAPPLVAEPSPAAPAGPQAQIPHLALSDMYDSNRTSEECFLQSYLTYIHLSGDAFDSDTLKIAWVLFNMKAGWASTYALCAECFSIDPAKSTALVLHNRKQYGQGKRMLNEYIDSFQALVKQAAYPDGLQLCLTFQDGLHPTLMECINNLAKGCLNDEQIASWYKVAQDQWQFMEIQWKLCWTHPAHRPTPIMSLWHPTSPHSVPAPVLAAPTPQSLSPGIPMDVDAA
ncbi:hypothetical protein C0993_002155 [Termitomyces sp. T159_Od127]|nr:hypothetical protein C0993_002155 [Termitomyces sp. T159_Od127]